MDFEKGDRKEAIYKITTNYRISQRQIDLNT